VIELFDGIDEGTGTKKLKVMKTKPVSVSSCVLGSMVITTVICDDGSVWRQNGLRDPWIRVSGPWE
jgi:hypothetical protein